MTLDVKVDGGKTVVIDREEVGCDDDWIHLAQDRFGWRAVASPGFDLLIPRKSDDSLATAPTLRFSKIVLMKHWHIRRSFALVRHVL